MALLFPHCLLEGALRVSDEILVASVIDKRPRALVRIVLKLREHIEVAPMRPREDITGQSAQHSKCVSKILKDAGVACGMVRPHDKMVFRPEADSAHNDDVAQRPRRFTRDMRAQGPCGTPACVAGRFMGGKRRTTQATVSSS